MEKVYVPQGKYNGFQFLRDNESLKYFLAAGTMEVSPICYNLIEEIRFLNFTMNEREMSILFTELHDKYDLKTKEGRKLLSAFLQGIKEKINSLDSFGSLISKEILEHHSYFWKERYSEEEYQFYQEGLLYNFKKII